MSALGKQIAKPAAPEDDTAAVVLSILEKAKVHSKYCKDPDCHLREVFA